MLKEMAALGFEYVELSHGIRLTLVPGILQALDEGIVKVASTHNFCPLPTGVVQAAPNLFMPSELDRKQHEQWLRHTKRSIDFAKQVKARAMVLHLGAVEFFWFNPSRKLSKYMDSHPDKVPGGPKYQAMLGKAFEKLRERMTPYWAQVRASIEEILPYAQDKGVKLGFENREKFDELPVDADFPAFLQSLSRPDAGGYWHDTGHAALKEMMGAIQHKQQLADNADKILGFHLHDVADGHDHQPIGSGKVDFAGISQFWKPQHLLTIEFGPRITVDEVIDSKAKIEVLIAARF